MKKNLPLITKNFLIVLLIDIFVVSLFGCAKSNNDTSVTRGELKDLTYDAVEADLGLTEEERAVFANASSDPSSTEQFHATYLEASSHMTELITVDDLNLPEDITANTKQPFGLFIYNGSDFVPYTTEGVFDESKKTLFFSHGMGSNGSFYNTKGYYEKGYNVLCFYWGIFADEMLYLLISEKVWLHDADNRYLKEDGSWADGKDMQYCVAEVYAAQYYDFLSRYPSYNQEILLGGHSYGGMLASALLSYLTTAYRCQLLDIRYLPDRVLLCDPFFRAGDNTKHVRWLNEMNPPKKGSLTALALEAIVMAKKIGISVALVRSSPLILPPFLASFSTNLSEGQKNLEEFNSSLCYVQAIALGMLGVEQAHNYGERWPAFRMEEAYDLNNPEEYSFSVFNPYHAEYARMGETYIVNYNNTPDNFTDDTVALQSDKKTKLYGFVFNDSNRNGILDERLGSHIRGALVSVKNENGVMVYEHETTINGYFECRVQPGAYTIDVVLPDGYTAETVTITVKETAYFAYAPIAATKQQ